MNTPSNAGKEHNPDGLTREQVGEGWRLLTKNEVIIEGDEWWNGAKWKQTLLTKPEALTPSEYTYRRRTTPPTQSQEGEMLELAERIANLTDEQRRIVNDNLLGKSTWLIVDSLERSSEYIAAQRENDRLRNGIANILASHSNDYLREDLNKLLNPTP